MNYKLPIFLLGFYIILSLFLAINPFGRVIWALENLPVWLIVIGLVATFSRFQFSNLSYFLMAFALFFHTIGAHSTFELAPFELGNRLLSLLNIDFLFPEARNNFDRFGHFLAGIFAYPIAELMLRKRWVNSVAVAILFAIFAIGCFAGLYEIIETIYAVIAGGDTGAMFLGSQGDIWDAQKDISLNILGAILASGLFFVLKGVKNE